MNKAEEERLTAEAKAGDRQALGLLWDEITPKLFGYLINCLYDKQVAEDALQSTWLKAIKALPNFQMRGISISAWLFAIARNELRLHFRNKTTEVLDDSLQNASTKISNHDDKKILVDQILNLLPQQDQELLRLRYIAGLATKDIAKVLNINFVAVRVRLHRAVNKARAAINNNL